MKATRVVDPRKAPDVGIRVKAGPVRVVMLAPEGEVVWGLFMFPSVWRLRDGRLVCAVTIGNDEMPSHADYHYLWYLSEDDGAHWSHAVVGLEEAEEFLRERQTLPDGRQVYFEPTMISLDAVEICPFDFTPEETLRGCRVFYRLGDLPEEDRTIRMFSRGSHDAEWQEDRVTMDPDIIVPAFMEPVLEDDPDLEPTHSVVSTWLRKMVRYIGDPRLPSLGTERPPTELGASFHLPRNRVGVNLHDASWGISPEDLVATHPDNIVIRLLLPSPTSARLHDQTYRPIMGLPDGRLFATSFGVHPAQALRVIRRRQNLDTGYYPNIFESTDGGRHWSYYGSVHYADVEGHRIYQAHMTPDMPGGNWMAMLRSDSALMLTRSYDDGHTWERPEAIRRTSVNPAGGLLPNGIAFRMYGRPGQYVTFCSDGEGVEWGNDLALVTGLGDPAVEQNRNTCANSCTFVTGSNRFLVVYTVYTHSGRGGKLRPAVLAREITAESV